MQPVCFVFEICKYYLARAHMWPAARPRVAAKTGKGGGAAAPSKSPQSHGIIPRGGSPAPRRERRAPAGEPPTRSAAAADGGWPVLRAPAPAGATVVGVVVASAVGRRLPRRDGRRGTGGAPRGGCLGPRWSVPTGGGAAGVRRWGGAHRRARKEKDARQSVGVLRASTPTYTAGHRGMRMDNKNRGTNTLGRRRSYPRDRGRWKARRRPLLRPSP